jgi:homoserine O-succinyltransferase/O-acetyltransferase
MPLLVDTPRSGSAADLSGDNCLTIGLVNNMPDAAVESTERQFVRLVRTATSGQTVRFALFSLAEVPRSEHARRRLAERYRDISELWDSRLDGLIVTGTEPRAARLNDEPYWSSLTKLVDWARENTVSTIWSCLAAHAAVLHADGIERQPLNEKLFGVFECDVVATHPLTKGSPRRLRVPHSRHNGLSASALTAAGYRVLSRSTAAGVDAFAKEERGRSLFLFLQGHPEYDADTLAREYRRDVGRFLRGEREELPATPQGYFNDLATAAAAAFSARAVCDRRASLVAVFPMADLEAGLENTWRGSAISLYENWVNYLADRKAGRRELALPVKRSARDLWPATDIRPAGDGSTAR